MTRYLLTVAIFALLMIPGCSREPAVWNPIVEQTHFDYLNTGVSKAISDIDNAAATGMIQEETTGRAALQRARQELMAIKDYYLPLTAVRQYIFDAERLFYMKRTSEAKSLIEKSKNTVLSLERYSTQEQVALTVKQLLALIEDAALSMDRSPKETFGKLKVLGEKVNLMLYKGDLVLSGVAFNS